MPRTAPPSSATTTTTESWTKRLLQELNAQSRSPLPSCILYLRPVSDAQLQVWEAVLRGVEGTAYQNGQWHLSIQIPSSYPHSPPKIKFDTPICHPNIAFQTGEICLELLQTAWTPVYTLASTVEAVHHLLRYPDVESPLNVDVALLIRSGDWVGAEGLVRWCCWEWRWEGEREGRREGRREMGREGERDERKEGREWKEGRDGSGRGKERG